MTYNVLITIYLAYLGVGEGFTGKLLWPAIAVRALLAVMLLCTRFFGQPTKSVSDGSDRSAAR